MKYSEELYVAIVTEIARLSQIIYQGVPETETKGLAMVINYLSGILAHKITVSDFHDFMSESPKTVREYYYELLYE